MRDLALARLTGTRVHFQHLSTARSIEMVRAAKADGLPVTCEATTHHFTLTHAECASLRPGLQGQPAAAHRRATWPPCKAGLADGTDRLHRHRPRARTPRRPRRPPSTRRRPACSACETALALALTELDLPIAEVLALLSWRPAAILGVDDEHGLPVAEGNPANLTVIDPSATWRSTRPRWPAAAATPPTPAAPSRAGSATPSCHGEPVVVDGEAQR